MLRGKGIKYRSRSESESEKGDLVACRSPETECEEHEKSVAIDLKPGDLSMSRLKVR